MGKPPAIQFYVRDWLSDPQLKQCSFSTKGMWIDLLCYMWDAPEKGLIKGTVGSIKRMLGATDFEMELFMQEITKFEFANVTCNGDVTKCISDVTIKNRRMWREFQDRENTRKRVQRHRDKKAKISECNEDVTLHSSSSSASSCTKVHFKAPFSPHKNSCPYEKITDLYHSTLPELPAIRKISPELKKKISGRWHADLDRQNLDWWQWYFDGIRECDFLTGRKKDWAASLLWLTGPENMEKVLSGYYTSKGKTKTAIEEFLHEQQRQ